jgi:hypothetical protein
MIRFESTEIKNWHMTKVRLNGGVVDRSTIILGTCADTVLKDVTFKNVLCGARDTKHLSAAKLDGVTFDDCIFAYVDCCNGFLRQARFRRCIFIRCVLDAGDDLALVAGSRGFFEYPEPDRAAAHFVEEAGQPYVWSRKKAELRVAPFGGVGGLDEVSWRERSEALARAPWEVALAVLFPARRGYDAQVALADVREKLRVIERLYHA